MRRPGLTLAGRPAAWLFAATCAAAPLPDLVPAPREWAPAPASAGTFDLPGRQRLVIDSRFRAELAPAGLLYRTLRAEQGRPADEPQFAAAASAGLFLTLDPTLPPDGYRFTITPARLTIAARSPLGATHAVQTLAQLLHHGRPIPAGVLTDHPDIPKRILLLDVGRKPTTKSELQDFIRMMSWYKFNELHLHLNDEAFGHTYAAFRLKTKTYPALAARDVSYDAADLRELQDFARLRGVTLVPEIDIPGHSEAFVNLWPELAFRGQRTYLDVNHPEMKVRLKRLFDEVIPLFDAPDFHIGTDEYRVTCRPDEKVRLMDDFMRFANEMAAYVESKGKTCRMWYGDRPDHRVSSIPPHPTATLDIWNIHRGVQEATRGHRLIHSDEHISYLVPGAPYYGVDNRRVYEKWNPHRVGDFDTTGTGLLVGAKLHVWHDYGPTGYTHAETADLLLPSLQAFSERLWGRRGSPDHAAFRIRAAHTLPIPGVRLLDRPAPGVLIHRDDRTITLASATDSRPCAASPDARLEAPWTLSLELRRTGDSGTRGVILSSDLVELCADLRMGDLPRAPGDKRGLGFIRASGGPLSTPATPADHHFAKDTAYTTGVALPRDKWVKLTVVAEPHQTTLYLDDQKIGSSPHRLVCPLLRYGSPSGHTFVGEIRHLTLTSGARTD